MFFFFFFLTWKKKACSLEAFTIGHWTFDERQEGNYLWNKDFCILWVPHSKFSLRSRRKKRFRRQQWIGQRSLRYRYTTVTFYMALGSVAVIWPTKQQALLMQSLIVTYTLSRHLVSMISWSLQGTMLMFRFYFCQYQCDPH